MKTLQERYDIINRFNNDLTCSGCMLCSVRHPERECIPKGFFVKGQEGSYPIVTIISYPRESDEKAGRILSGADRNTLKKWLTNNYPNMYMTTAVKCRTIRDREPHKKEINVCAANYLKYEIGILQPKVVLALGKVAVKGLFGVTDKEAGTMLNKVFDKKLQDSSGVFWSGKIYTTYHPGFFEMGGGHTISEEDICMNVIQQAFKENTKNG